MNKFQTEFETKVINIDKEAIVKMLRELGAQETPEFLARRFVYDLDTPDVEWIRLRRTNTKTTLTYKFKKLHNTEIGKTIEIEVDVSDFDKTAEIFSKIPFRAVYYQENKSHIFHLNDIEFSIDTWPMLPPYLEIESDSVEKVQEGLKLLELQGQDVGDKDIKLLYGDIGIKLHTYKELKF
jgi:adenylate cyclase class 2